MNFTKSIKDLLRLFFSRTTISIKTGPLLGWQISLASGTRFIKGNYEPEKTAAFCKVVKNGFFVIDVGGHIGYFALIASKLVGSEGLVWTFEPTPRQFKILTINVEANKVQNIILHQKAVAERNQFVLFDLNTGSGTGHISNDGQYRVEAVALDTLSIPRPPNLIKIDIEGGEMNALRGASKLITQHRPIVLVAVHSEELKRSVVDYLETLSYTITILNPTATKGDLELLAIPIH